MKKQTLFLLLSAFSLFASSREDDLKVILEKTYLSEEAEPILNMAATQAIEETGVSIEADQVIGKFHSAFHEKEIFAELAKPYEGLFTDEEVSELRKIHENPVWQKYAQQGTAIFSANIMTMKGVFKDLAAKFITNPAIVGDIWQLSDLDQLKQSDKPVIVEVSATWCSACRQMEPVFDQVSYEYQDQVQFAKMDVDQQHTLAKKFGIKGLPTLLFFYPGETKPAVKSVGAISKEEFESKIDQFLKRMK